MALKKTAFVVSIVLSLSARIMGMQTLELIDLHYDAQKHVMTFLGISSASSLLRACKPLYKVYEEGSSVISFLRDNPEQHYVLSKEIYLKGLIHFSEENNFKYVDYLIQHENSDNKKQRIDLLTLFGYKMDAEQQDSKTTLWVCKGMAHDAITAKNVHSIKEIVSRRMVENKPEIVKLLIKELIWLRVVIDQMFLELFYPGHLEPTTITFLHWACEFNHRAIVELLLSEKVNINIAAGKNGYTPLHTAVKANSMQITAMLIAQGAHINVKDKQNNFPLDYATTVEMQNLLIKNGAIASKSAKKHCVLF